MLIAVTHYKMLNSNDAAHFIKISPYIDRLILRTPMSDKELSPFLNTLLESGFPKEKIIVHSSIELLESFNLQAVHFKEHDVNAFKYKHQHPDVSVSISTHSVESVRKAQLDGLDFVLFGHIFDSASKKDLLPRTHEEISEALSFDIPAIALGGINLQTIRNVPPGFSGIAAISGFMNATIEQIIELRKEWRKSDLMS